jgi:hypothetical protein
MLYPELKKGCRTMSRGLNTRIQKLEACRHSDGEMLLLWRPPGKDVATVVEAAKTAGLFASGDLVISAEWLGEDPMPAPRWFKSERDLSEREGKCIDAEIFKLVGEVSKIEIDRSQSSSLSHISSERLLHILLGVET